MKKYLMGSTYEMNEDDSLYPLTFVDTISKDDLLRCKRDDIIIINLIDRTFFSHKKNEWIVLKQVKEFKDIFNKN